MREDKLVNELSYPLVLDVSSPTVQTGIALSGGWDKLTSSQNQPMDGLFQCIEQLNIDLNKIDSLFFCACPGSTLGLRLALAFVKTVQWKIGSKLKLFSYNALDLACKMTDAPPLFVQAPFRMGWRLVRSSADKQAIGKKRFLKVRKH